MNAAAEIETIGVGVLGYAFMGKAHANAYRTLSYMTWPPPLRPELVAIAGRGGRQARDLREAAGTGRGRDLRDLAAGGRRRRQAHVRFQLPVRAGRAARTGNDRGWRAWRDSSLPVSRRRAHDRERDYAQFVTDRSGHWVDVDDAFQAAVEFESGANGTLEPEHPFMNFWWPTGHIIGWEHTFVHELHHLLAAIAGDGEVRPGGADFEDGYRAAVVCDAIVRSADSGRRERLEYLG